MKILKKIKRERQAERSTTCLETEEKEKSTTIWDIISGEQA